MKRALAFWMILLVGAMLSAAPALATEPAFTLQRLVSAVAVEEREPVGVADLFAANLERIYAFAELRDIADDTEVTFVWLRDGGEVARVPLAVRQGNRWRTFSSITLAGRSGDWRVELHDPAGTTVGTVEFTVR